MIYGAIIGDIVGSRFEFANYRGTDFEFFEDTCKITDDSLMTIAVASAVLTNEDPSRLGEDAIYCMQQIGRPHRDAGWGASFGQWIYTDNPKPYNSFGNGAAMRVSICGWQPTLEDVLRTADAVTAVSHDHEEGIRGARAVAESIYTARTTKNKGDIFLAAYKYYPIIGEQDFTLDNIRETYQFNETCQDTVPQAIQAFMESDNFEDAIRKAVSIGGDSDTVAAIAGSIAEAFYGIPQYLKNIADIYLPDNKLVRLVHLIEQEAKERYLYGIH